MSPFDVLANGVTTESVSLVLAAFDFPSESVHLMSLAHFCSFALRFSRSHSLLDGYTLVHRNRQTLLRGLLLLLLLLPSESESSVDLPLSRGSLCVCMWMLHRELFGVMRSLASSPFSRNRKNNNNLDSGRMLLSPVLTQRGRRRNSHARN